MFLRITIVLTSNVSTTACKGGHFDWFGWECVVTILEHIRISIINVNVITGRTGQHRQAIINRQPV